MKRLLLSATILLALGAFMFVSLGASSSRSSSPTYKIELDNAFGLVTGADFKVAGVRAGTIESLSLPPGCMRGNTYDCHALVTVSVTQKGFGQFHSDAFCQSRPQSLIGEYFVECQPGQSGSVLKSGSTIPVSHTQSTIPGDLLQNVMRMPYRERFTLIINELGAAVAGRSGDLAAALRRAVPALTQTDNLLNLLANDSHTLQQLTVHSDSVITALANNSGNVERFITEADKAATATATQQTNLAATFHKLPGFLEQLRPAMAKLGAATAANTPVLANLRSASAELNRLFTDLPGFAHSSLPAIRSLGKASVTGRQAVNAAGPTIADLNAFSKHTPELAQNLSIVLRDLNSRSRAVEADSRSPHGKGYTGIEALLQYVFNQALAVNGFSQFGHFLTVDAFVDPRCAPYATPTSVAAGLKNFGASYRQCYAWLGKNQPGINETDPSNPHACVPDPGGAPPGQQGPATTACRLSASDVSSNSKSSRRGSYRRPGARTKSGSSPGASAGSGSGSVPSASVGGLGSTLGQLLGLLGSGTGGGAAPSATSGSGRTGPATPSRTASGSGSGAGAGQAQQLINYLLAP